MITYDIADPALERSHRIIQKNFDRKVKKGRMTQEQADKALSLISWTKDLRECGDADVITHVVDASNPDRDAQVGVVYSTLANLGVRGKPIVALFNKCDLLPEEGPVLRDERAEKSIRTSMVTGEGIEAYLSELEHLVNEDHVYLERVYPFADAGKIQTVRKYGQLLEEKYTEEGIFVRAYVPKSMVPQKEDDYE